MITVLLAFVLGTSLVIAYTTLRRAAVGQAEARLEQAADALDAQLDVTLTRGKQSVADVARQPLVRQLVEQPGSGDRDSVSAVLGELVPENDTLTTAEIWDRSGHRLLAVGRAATSNELESPGETAAPEPARGSAPRDSVERPRILPIRISNGVPEIGFVAPVSSTGGTPGYVVRRRRIAAGPQVERRSAGCPVPTWRCSTATPTTAGWTSVSR